MKKYINNKFTGNINGKNYKDFYAMLSELESGTSEENIKALEEILNDEYWVKVFLQQDEDEFIGGIKLLLDKSDNLYSDTNIAKLLETLGTFILSGDKAKDNPNYIRVFNNREMFKKAINEANFITHLEDTVGRGQDEFVLANTTNYKVKRDFDKTAKDLAEIDALYGEEYPIIHEYYQYYVNARKQLKRLNDLSKERTLTDDEKKAKKMWTNCVKTYKEDILDLVESKVRPIKFKCPLKDNGSPSWDEYDEKDEEHIRMALRINKDEIDLQSDLGAILFDLNKTISMCSFTDIQAKVLDMYRSNMTQEEIARELDIKQQVVNRHINAIVKIITDKNWEIYEDWYYLNIAKGTYKTCKQCGEVKLISRFDKDKRGTFGVRSVCKECRRK